MSDAGKLMNIRVSRGDPSTAEITVGGERLAGVEQISIVLMPDAPATAVLRVRLGELEAEVFGSALVDAHAAFLRELADEARGRTCHAFDQWADLERRIRLELGEWKREDDE